MSSGRDPFMVNCQACSASDKFRFGAGDVFGASSFFQQLDFLKSDFFVCLSDLQLFGRSIDRFASNGSAILFVERHVAIVRRLGGIELCLSKSDSSTRRFNFFFARSVLAGL